MNHPFFQFIKKYEKFIFLLLTIIFGILLLAQVSDHQTFIAPGDHGRDFYCFEKTLEGQAPYRDYWWVYGPIMPYFYAFFYKLFGISVKTILLGKHFLVILSAVLFYLTLSLFSSPLLAFLGAGWFYLFQPDFFYTYNHIGGIAVILFNAYLITRYIQKQKTLYLYLMCLCFFLLYMIKINFGIFALICSGLSVIAIDIANKRRFFTKDKIRVILLALILTPAITYGIYNALLHKMPLHEIKQCLPYLAEDHPYNSSIYDSAKTIVLAIKKNMTKSPSDITMAILINLSLLQIVLSLFKKRNKDIPLFSRWMQKKEILLIFAIFCFFYIAFTHEYIASGVLYRYFWAKPFVLLLMFTTLSLGTRTLSPAIRKFTYLPLALILTLQAIAIHSGLNAIKVPRHRMNHPRASLYLSNSPDWIKTVETTAHLLSTNLKEDETFFALPYDPLYYFLTDKTSPTRQLIFFEHINIPQEQERKIINELETKKVNWIVVSSRSNAKETGLGRFGVTYCTLLGAYIKENFTVEAQIGDWVNEPLWAHHHGTKILKRK